MASYFNITLDTTAPGGASIVLESGASYTGTQTINARLATSDGTTTGYQIKIWGDVDTSYDSNVQASEGASSWVTVGGSFPYDQTIKLSTGDGSKTVYAKIRDDVWNETSQLSDTITLDTVAPVVTIVSGPDATKVSKVSGKRTVNFGWQSDIVFDEYKVKVVPASNSIHTAGTTLLTTNGSSNVSGTAGSYPATTTINTAIDGRDLEVADTGDGTKIIKVFVKSPTGNWSSA